MTDSTLASLGAGEQVLVRCPSAVSPITYLPESAFEDLLVVSTTRGPRAVEGLLRDRSVDPSSVSLLHATGARPRYDGPLRIVGSNDPSDVHRLGLRYLEAIGYLEPLSGWVVLDNVTALSMYAEGEDVLKLLTSVADQAGQTAVRGVYAAVPDTFEPSTRDRFEALFDRTTTLEGAGVSGRGG